MVMAASVYDFNVEGYMFERLGKQSNKGFEYPPLFFVISTADRPALRPLLVNRVALRHNIAEVKGVVLSRQCQPMTPSAFGLAVQALAFLALSDTVCPSQQIAKMMQSGTSFMRRVMAPLVRARLVEAREGRDGGYLLAKPANVITVADVYRALQMADPLGAGLLGSTTDCPNGEAIRRLFSEMTTRAEKGLLEVYEEYTIAQIATASMGNAR